MTRRYLDFRAFFGGWFHQDYHCEGDSVDEIVAAFRKSATIDDIRPIRNDIAAFLRDHEDAIDEAFDREFQPAVDPRAFSGTTRAFLEAIDRALTAV